MSSQIDEISVTNEKKNVERSPSEALFRVRKYLLILIIIQWIVCIIGLAVRIYSETIENEQDDISNKLESLIPIFAITFYYTCGLLFIYKYHRIGILIFASIGTLLLIITCLLVIYTILVIIVLGLDYNNMTLAFRFFLIFGLIFGAFTGVVIVTLQLAFNLARLIKTNGYSIV